MTNPIGQDSVTEAMILAEVTAYGPVNGMGERDKSGSYTMLAITPKGAPTLRFKISRGAADVLTTDLAMSQASPPPEDFNMPTIGDHILMILGQYRDDMPPDAIKAFQQIAALTAMKGTGDEK